MTQQKTDATADKLSADVKALREQIEKLSEGQREIPLLRAEVVGQDKRLSDTINRIGDVNTWLTAFGIVFAVFVAGVGIFAFVQAARRAKEEAREWLEENSQELLDRVEQKRVEAEAFVVRIEESTRKAASGAAHIEELLNGTLDKAKKYTAPEKEEFQKASHEVMDRPPNQYTAKDWRTLAYAAYSDERWDDAATFFGLAVSSPDASEENIARNLVDKAVSLGKLSGRSQDELAVYDEIVRRFSASENDVLREQAAKAIYNSSIVYKEIGDFDKFKDAVDDLDRRFGCEDSFEVLELVLGALIGKGSDLSQRGDNEEAICTFDAVVKRLMRCNGGVADSYFSEAFGSRGWVKYKKSKDAEFMGDTECALQYAPDADWLLCNKAFALYLNSHPRAEVMTAYEQAWQVINDPAKWEEFALADLRAHGRTVRTDSPPVPDDLIEAVAALAKGTE